MKTYKIKTRELQWYDCYYTVEADSEEEARELIESEYETLPDDMYYDCTNQVDFKSIEIVE